MWDVIEGLVAEGTTVLLCTLYLEEADRLAERVVILDEDRVVAVGPPEDLRRQVGGILVELTLRDVNQRARAVQLLGQVDTSTVAGMPDDPGLRVPVPDAECLADVVRLLDAESLSFSGLELCEPTLDDVFLALTGHPTAPTKEPSRPCPSPPCARPPLRVEPDSFIGVCHPIVQRSLRIHLRAYLSSVGISTSLAVRSHPAIVTQPL